MTDAPTVERTRVLAARRAVFLVFAVNGMAFATWASRIPDAKAALGLTPGALGTTLVAGSAGSVLGLLASGWISHRLGPRASVVLGVLGVTVGLVVMGAGVTLAHSRLLLGLGLVPLGLCVGIWDVGMNLEGARVEQLLKVAVMPRFHAAFSGGTVLAALLGALMAGLHVPLLVHFVLAAVVLLAVCLVSVRTFLPHVAPGSQPQDAQTPRGGVFAAWSEPRTLVIGLVVLVAAFTEGTANDWVSVAFHEGYGVPTWAGVLAFAVFLGSMTVGRWVGTSWLERWGRVPVLRVTLGLAAVGSVLVVLGPAPLAYVGAAVWGLGVSLGFPVGMSAAADDPRRAAGRVSVVATIGYTAFVLGPPFLGYLGDHVTVLKALTAVGALVLPALLLVPALREPAGTRPTTP